MRIVALGLLLALAGNATAPSVPFTLALEGRVVVSARAAGDVPLKVILDTGADLDVFRNIIYDCVIGVDFWAGKIVTIDIPGRRLIVALP